jgi:hypothetical protein
MFSERYGGPADKSLILQSAVILADYQDRGFILASYETPAVVFSTAADGSILSA